MEKQMYACRNEDCDGGAYQVATAEFGRDEHGWAKCMYCGSSMKELRKYSSLDEFVAEERSFSDREQAVHRLGVLDFVIWAIDNDALSTPDLVYDVMVAERNMRVRQLAAEDDAAGMLEAEHFLEHEDMIRQIQELGE